jgi:hypothetical protein
MDPKVYEEFALSLEAPADNDCIMRIKAQALQFGEILNTLSKVGSKADKLKKLAFYGKSLTKQQRQPVPPPRSACCPRRLKLATPL